jgi:hypothetical protein
MLLVRTEELVAIKTWKKNSTLKKLNRESVCLVSGDIFNQMKAVPLKNISSFMHGTVEFIFMLVKSGYSKENLFGTFIKPTSDLKRNRYTCVSALRGRKWLTFT